MDDEPVTLNLDLDVGSVTHWSEMDDHNMGMVTVVEINLLDVEVFENFSDTLVHSGIRRDEKWIDISVFDSNELIINLATELFKIEESANYATMKITLYGYDNTDFQE